MKVLVLSLYMCLPILVFSQINKGKKCLSSDSYTITYEKKSQQIYIYTTQEVLLNSYVLKDIPKFKKRLKHISWVDPEGDFTDVPRTGYSNFYETKTHLFFTFNVYHGHLGALYILSYDKAENVFEYKRTLFPNSIVSFKNNSHILKDKLYLVQINAYEVVVEVRNVFDPDKTIKRYSYNKGAPLEPANTPIYMSFDTPVLLGFNRQGIKTFNKKKEAKSLKKLINKGSQWGSKIKANEIAEGMIEVSLGTHYVLGADQMTRTEKMFYFKLVLDENTLAPISNETLENADIKLVKEIFKGQWN